MNIITFIFRKSRVSNLSDLLGLISKAIVFQNLFLISLSFSVSQGIYSLSGCGHKSHYLRL